MTDYSARTVEIAIRAADIAKSALAMLGQHDDLVLRLQMAQLVEQIVQMDKFLKSGQQRATEENRT